jgi:pyruvate dehydrogenase E2 component (dihydrolipoyllysine-residue acetyltransferase)
VATEVKLPRLGQGMESGTIVKWLKSEGEKVEKGDPLYELDTEKVTQEVEAEASGVLLKIAIAEGEVEVGKTIAFIGEEGEKVQAESPDGDSAKAAAESPDGDSAKAAKVESAPEEEGAPGDKREEERDAGSRASAEPVAPTDGDLDSRAARVKASPLARRIARERGIDLSGLTGTGPEGRIVAEDVERASASPAAVPPAPGAAPPAGIEVVPLTTLRKTIARRLTQAWEVPAFQISMSADMTRVIALRKRLVEQTPEGAPRPTVTDVLAKVCALALIRHRAVNARYSEEGVELYPTANVGLAVATAKGLVVPVIPSCERRTIAEVAVARADVVQRAQQGSLQQADFEGGTFTISNLGMYGVEQFIAVLNPPQAAILAVGATEERPVVREGELVARPMMTMTLTCDHRVVDGAVAAEFLQTVKDFLEEPGLAL